MAEHGLYQYELYKLGCVNTNYQALSKSRPKLRDEKLGVRRGPGGCALLWHKRLSNSIKPLPNLGSDRMCVVEIILPDSTKLYVISVYLPHQTCQIADFKQDLGILENVIANCHNDGIVLAIKVTNAHLGRSLKFLIAKPPLLHMLYCMNWLTYEFWTRIGRWAWWGCDRSHGDGTSTPSYWQQVEEQAPKPVGCIMCFLLMTFADLCCHRKLCVNIYIYICIYMYILTQSFRRQQRYIYIYIQRYIYITKVNIYTYTYAFFMRVLS